jgi:hypothetical protein
MINGSTRDTTADSLAPSRDPLAANAVSLARPACDLRLEDACGAEQGWDAPILIWSSLNAFEVRSPPPAGIPSRCASTAPAR